MKQSYERKHKQELRAEFAAMQFQYMATMNYRKRLSGGVERRRRTVVSHLREWNRQVLEALFGRKFSKRNDGDAVLAVAFIEVGPLLSKEHIHVLIRVPAPLQAKFEATAAALWQPWEGAAAEGQTRRPIEADILVKKIGDLDGAIRYSLKDVRADSDSMIFSNEFRNAA